MAFWSRKPDTKKSTGPVLVVEGLDVYYGRAHALQSVSFTIDHGVLGIVGRNGMGKTTLCNAITGLVPATGSVKLLGEVGLGSVKAGEEAQQMVAWARKYGIQSTIHTGGPSVPGSGYIDKDVVLEADADVIGHINGGHTALPWKHVCELCEKSSRAIEIVHNGNERVAIAAAQAAIAVSWAAAAAAESG